MSSISSPISGVPIGTSIEWNGETPPAGFLEENGAEISRAVFAGLFAEIGTTHGAGDGSTTFNIPDSRRRVAVGAGGAGTGVLANTVGSAGGEEAVGLTGANNGPHTHGYPGVGGTNGSTTGLYRQRDGGAGSYPSSSSGNGTPHNNIQPSIVKMKCIKY